MKRPKAYWNYRILAHKNHDGDLTFAVHEVHYENDIPQAYSENPIAASEDSINEVIEDIQMMLEDIKNKPTLWADEKFPTKFK